MSWKKRRIWTFLEPVKRQGYPNEMLLSVYRDYGVIPKASRDDNHNRAGKDMSVYQLVEPTNVVMNKMKAWQGSIAVSRHRGLVSPDYMVLRIVRENVHPPFLHYLLRSRHMIAEYRRHAYGVRPAQWRLMYTEFRELEVAFPEESTQRAIADFLDRKTAAIDALIEKKERLLELLAEKRAALIHRAVTKGLDPSVPMKDSGVPWIGEIPAHWTTRAKLQSLTGTARGAFVNGPFGSDLLAEELTKVGVPVVYIRDIKPLGYRRKSTVCVTPEKARQLDVCRVDPGDVVVSKVGSPPGDACVYPAGEPSGIITQDVIRLKLTAQHDPHFVALLLNSTAGREAVAPIIVESTRARVALGDYKRLRIHVPPLKGQREIVSWLSPRLRRLDEVGSIIRDQNAKLAEYRQAVITAAVTGQLDIDAAERQPIPATDDQLGLFGGAA